MTQATIVIPCYNEAKRLPVQRFVDYVQQEPRVRLLFVDDGSTDETFRVLEEMCAAAPGRCEALRLERNAGKGEAVRQGILHAFSSPTPSQYAGFWDADLATPLATIGTFIDFAEQHPQLEIVMGARVNLLGRTVERQALRHYLGRLVATAISSVLGVRVYDTQCGAKLFRMDEKVRRMFEAPFLTRWLFDVEILARWIRASRREGYPPVEQVAYEIPLPEWIHVKGSKVTALDFFRAGRDLMRIGRAYLW